VSADKTNFIRNVYFGNKVNFMTFGALINIHEAKNTTIPSLPATEVM